MKAGAVMMAFAIALLVAALVAISVLRAEPERAVASESGPEPTVEPLKRSKPAVKAWVEKTREPVAVPEPEPEPVPQAEPKPAQRPQPEPEQEPPPVAAAELPLPTNREVEKASEPRHYDLPPGAK